MLNGRPLYRRMHDEEIYTIHISIHTTATTPWHAIPCTFWAQMWRTKSGTEESPRWWALKN